MILRLKNELLAAEHVLDTKYSFDLAEPHYRQCLDIIRCAPALQDEFEEILIDLYSRKQISHEPLAYLMHVLRWPRIRNWLENELMKDPSAIATGADHAKIIAAYNEDWQNKEFYKFA